MVQLSCAGQSSPPSSARSESSEAVRAVQRWDEGQFLLQLDGDGERPCLVAHRLADGPGPRDFRSCPPASFASDAPMFVVHESTYSADGMAYRAHVVALAPGSEVRSIAGSSGTKWLQFHDFLVLEAPITDREATQAEVRSGQSTYSCRLVGGGLGDWEC